jgi:general secretion pathway protein K
MKVQNNAKQSGAALISAMLVVTLVATLASVALWQQWRSVEVEVAERHRVQSSWLLNGAMDWTRLILREDALAGVAGASLSGTGGSISANGGVDHLGEPWALPLKEAKLSTFLSQDQQLREGDPEVFLSGQVSDAQGRLNLSNWIEAPVSNQTVKLSEPMRLSMQRLFNVLGLPASELESLSGAWLAATQASRSVSKGPSQNQTSLLPQQIAQLQWLGLSPQTVQRLAPHISILPEASPVNVNTASAEVLYAAVPGLELSTAQKFVQQRSRAHFKSLTDAALALDRKTLDSSRFSVGTRYFEVWGRLRMEDRTLEETALIFRDGGQTSFVWRQKIAGILPSAQQDSLLQSSQP